MHPSALDNGGLFFDTYLNAGEALTVLEAEGIQLDALRVRAFPFQDSVIEFVNEHDHVFVVEQNRDAQLRTLLLVEGQLDPTRLSAVLHYDGTPITARAIHNDIAKRLSALQVTPLRRTAAGGASGE